MCCALFAASAGGCLERRVFITSDPPGALATVNGVQVGRTPTEFDFEWYGVYDVTLELEGHEPLITTGEAKTPAHEIPGIDLITTVAPVKFTNEVRWHYTLTPTRRDPEGLIERATSLRGTLGEPPGAASGSATPTGSETSPGGAEPR